MQAIEGKGFGEGMRLVPTSNCEASDDVLPEVKPTIGDSIIASPQWSFGQNVYECRVQVKTAIDGNLEAWATNFPVATKADTLPKALERIADSCREVIANSLATGTPIPPQDERFAGIKGEIERRLLVEVAEATRHDETELAAEMDAWERTSDELSAHNDWE